MTAKPVKKRRRSKAEMEEYRKRCAEACTVCELGAKLPIKYHGLDCPERTRRMR